MSAIYGIVGQSETLYSTHLESMRSRLLHRGTHTREWNPARNVYLGELSSAQGSLCNREELPMAADVSLFNSTELIHQLTAGAGTNSSYDAYTLIYDQFQKYGPDCFRHLNGDFVIALWDNKEKRLLLARDPLGARSLYYYCATGLIAFASEYKALLALDEVSAEPDLSGLQQLQNAKYLTPERTLIRSIHQVPAGHWLEIRDFGVSKNRYWHLQIEPRQIDLNDAEQQLRDHFFQAVKRRIHGTNSVGVELSGGIDSAAIVAAVRKYRPDDQLKTFTIGSGPDDTEVQMARVVAHKFNTDHHETFVDLDRLLDDLPLLVWHLEDPVGRTEAYLQFSLMREAAQHVNLVLGGYASDNLLAGMPKHKLVKIAQLTPIGKKAVEEFYDYTQTSRSPRSLLGKAATRVYFGPQELPAPRIVGAPPDSGSPVFPPGRRGLLNKMLHKGVVDGIPVWMPKVEKVHAAHGVEFHSPFTDPDLVRFSFELPEHFKMHYFKEKYILRRALMPLLPPEIVSRSKFPQRIDYDLELSEAIDALAGRYLNGKTMRERGFFREADIVALRRRSPGQRYSGSRAMRLWTAIVTELWAQIFLDNRGAPLAG